MTGFDSLDGHTIIISDLHSIKSSIMLLAVNGFNVDRIFRVY
jgi:hypothetical protein